MSKLFYQIPLIAFIVIFFISCSQEESKSEPPTCSIISPENGDEFSIGSKIIISVEADDADGNISKVVYYINGTEIGSSSDFPYLYEWDSSDENIGDYTLKATANDNSGLSTSHQLSIGLKEESKSEPPTCSIISPENGDEFSIGSKIVISVEADDVDGSISHVVYCIDGNEIGSSSDFPYTYEWDSSNENIGNHTLKAIANDNSGVSTSHEISIALNKDAPVVDFIVDTTIVGVNNTINFIDKSTNQPISWLWDFGDGSISTDQNPMHIYKNSGNYTVSLTVSNLYGTDSLSKTSFIDVRLVDYDGNLYKTVKIGDQEWFAENLKVTHYPNGKEIPLVTVNSEWADLTGNEEGDAYCYYDNNKDSQYGALYTYSAALDACPVGWHLPSDDEWKTLEIYLGMSKEDADEVGYRGTDEGKMLKADVGWSDNKIGTDVYSFSALPSGLRNGIQGDFIYGGVGGYWWCSKDENAIKAYFRSIVISQIERYSVVDKTFAYSVRCIKD